MPNDIVVQSDKNGGKVHLSADRVYDLNKNKTQDAINAEFEPLMQLDSEVAIVIDGRSCTLGAVSGQYVILQNSTIAGKSDGLYTVATGKTIPIGATNVTADMLTNPIPRGGLNHLSESVKNTLNQKQDILTFDNTPTDGSSNPVTSDGIYDKFLNYPNILDVAINDIGSVLSGSLISLTGTIVNNLSSKISGNVLIIGGRIRISVTSRTGGTGGVRYTLPNNKVLDGAFNLQVGISSYSDAQRNGESTIIAGNSGGNYINVMASESFANIQANKTLLMFVSPTIIKLKDGT